MKILLSKGAKLVFKLTVGTMKIDLGFGVGAQWMRGDEVQGGREGYDCDAP